MSEERSYRGATIRRRYRDRRPHGWWLLPEGPLEGHPDRAWVLTFDEAKAEVDGHLRDGTCQMRDRGRWLGVKPEVRQAADSVFERTMFGGFSAWCAVRAGTPNEACSSQTYRCECHRVLP